MGQLDAMLALLGNDKKFRIVKDGNDNYRVQTKRETLMRSGPFGEPAWEWDCRVFPTLEDARKACGSVVVKEVVEVL